MSLIAWRRSQWTAPTVVLTLMCFLATLLPPRVVRAQSTTTTPPPTVTGGPSDLNLPTPAANSPEALVTTDLATGTAHASYTFKLPTARGDAQPSLGIRYNSSQGLGMAGVGWALTVPSIVRKGAAAIPRFQDAVLSAAAKMGTDLGTDDYTIDGQLLVPIATLDTPPALATNETFPVLPTSPSAAHWVYFRREVDDGWRYFFNGLSWLVQTKSGHLLTFGSPLDQIGQFGPFFAPASTESADAVTVRALGASNNGIYRWNLVRDADATGKNTVYYVWDDESQLFTAGAPTAGTQYLTDIYDTPVAGVQKLSAGSFAHHVHLTWGLAQYPNGFVNGVPPASVPYASSPIWRALPFAQLATVDVTSATWSGAARQLVREYQLHYTQNATATRSYLTSIAMVGNCATAAPAGIAETPAGPLAPGATSGCQTMPSTTYGYSGIQGPSSGPPVLKETPITKWDLFPNSTTRDLLATPFQLVDLDGDGAADLVDPGGTEPSVQFGNSTRLGLTAAAAQALPNPRSSATGSEVPKLVFW